MDLHFSVLSNGLKKKHLVGGRVFKYDVHILIQVKAFSSPSPFLYTFAKMEQMLCGECMVMVAGLLSEMLTSFQEIRAGNIGR